MESFTGLCICKRRLNNSALKLGKRIGIEEIEISLAFRNVCRVLNVKETVIEADGSIHSVSAAYPVNSSFNLSSVRRFSAVGSRVVGYVYRCNVAVCITFVRNVLNKICTF